MRKMSIVLAVVLTALGYSQGRADELELPGMTDTTADQFTLKDIRKLDAKAFSSDGAWTVKEWKSLFKKRDLSSGALNGVVLDASGAKAGTAKATVPISRAGKYKIWVRYVDDTREPKTGPARAFTVRLTQNGKTVASKEINQKSLSAFNKWEPRNFRWESLDASLKTGELGIVMESGAPGNGTEISRAMDCVLVSPLLSYVPNILDFAPLYVQAQVSPKQKEPVTILVNGIKMRNAQNKEALKPGEKSQWMNLSEFLKGKGPETYAGVTLNPYDREGDFTSFYTLVFSRNASDKKGVLRKIEHQEKGKSFLCKINPCAGIIETDEDWSAINLKRAEAVGPVDGKRPRKFIIGLGLPMGSNFFLEQSIENEMKAQATLGATGYYSGPLGKKYGFDTPGYGNEFLDANQGCFCSPDRERMKSVFSKYVERIRKSGALEKMISVGVMDEPAFGVSAIMGCKSKTTKCPERFREYLQKNNVKPADLGFKSYEEINLSRDPNDTLRFYWTVRYRNHVLVEYYRAMTETIREAAPHLRTHVNIATELVSNGNMVQFGVDWYEMYNTCGLTCGQTEDWSNLSPTKQISGYIMDVMRSATRRNNLPFDMLTILGNAWVVEAKAFSEIARGAKSITFFRYGPGYTGASDSQSDNPDTYKAVKRVAFPVGAVEDQLTTGAVAPGDAGMLLSVTGDIYQILNFANPYGRERIWQHLLLSHCGIRLDIIGECDIVDHLKNYKTLFVCDANIRKEYLAPLVAWVKQGGTLILTSDALSRDEADKPLGFDEAVGLQRGKAEINIKNFGDKTNDYGTLAGDSWNLRLLNGFQEIKNGTPIPGFKLDGKNLAAKLSCGKGVVIALGMMPGFSYAAMNTSSKVPGASHTIREYPADGRNLMQAVLKQAGLNPRLSADESLVEAIWNKSPSGDVITLVNWTGKTCTTTVTFKQAPDYKTIEPYSAKILKQNRTGDTLTLTVQLDAGAHLLLKP